MNKFGFVADGGFPIPIRRHIPPVAAADAREFGGMLLVVAGIVAVALLAVVCIGV